VKAELYHGAFKSTSSETNLALLKRFESEFTSFPFDDRAAQAYGRLRTALERSGTPIGSYDLLIAAIAVTNDLTLVTHNTREFGRISELRLEDWEA